MKISDVKLEYHRNGIINPGFNVVVFTCTEGRETRRMLGILFDDPGYCAILDLDKLNHEDIKFGSNSWRSDMYESLLRKEILDSHEETKDSN